MNRWYRDAVTGWLVWVAYILPNGRAIARVTGEMGFGEWPMERLVMVRSELS